MHRSNTNVNTNCNIEMRLQISHLPCDTAKDNGQQNHLNSVEEASNTTILKSKQEHKRLLTETENDEDKQHTNGIGNYCCTSSDDITIIGAVSIIVNICLGAGLLNFPSTFGSVGGIIGGILIQLVLIPFISSTHLILAYCVDKKKASYSYQSAVSSILGTKVKIISEVLLILFSLSTCITYLVIIGDQSDEIIIGITGQQHQWYTNRKFVMSIISTLFILPLSLLKNIGSLRYSSILGTVAVINVAIVVMIEFFINDYHKRPIYQSRISNWSQIASAFSTICFGFHCHISSIPSYEKLRDRSIKRFNLVIIIAMLVCIVVYSITGSFGYMSFGNSVNSDILLNYGSSNILVTISRIMISINMVTSYPVLHFCARQVVEELWLNFRNLNDESAKIHKKSRLIIQTLSWFVVTLSLSLFVPNVGDIIALAGGFAALFIFVFPGFCLIGLRYNFNRKYHVACICYGSFLAILGIFLFGMATTKAIYDFSS
ncbi:putative sodium-coupled neutral amino acid transporter 7 [Trichoplax sp. H2]|nr:putative sodium-coupled neutral amino acid transporter 7 [Trichoplax sp. H2]|eukprot:RDD47151.1 putative sodium-coupled neutral amino acid transporter 7 [Trichoplax sp. H2]